MAYLGIIPTCEPTTIVDCEMYCLWIKGTTVQVNLLLSGCVCPYVLMNIWKHVVFSKVIK